MKSLDFDTRSLIAKECINRVCEAARLKTVDKKRRTDKRILRMLADTPNMGMYTINSFQQYALIGLFFPLSLSFPQFYSKNTLVLMLIFQSRARI